MSGESLSFRLVAILFPIFGIVAVIERKDNFTEKTANALTPPKAFTILSGKTVVDKTAVLRAYEFVVVHIPASGKATVVAAADQLYAASGS